jgi:hypothetical protein
MVGRDNNRHEGLHLTQAVMRAELDLGELDAEAIADAEALNAEIAANQAAF